MNDLIVACQLAKQMGVQVDPDFKWRLSGGNGVRRPQQMDTSHLFNVVKMIWNNRMPREWRVGAVKLYEFGPSHSDEYLKTSICHIMAELMQRSDLTREQVEILRVMHEHLYAAQVTPALPQEAPRLRYGE